ncbi:MAG: hydroxymethylbilane synthase [Treponema sp.]|nr:hydroxymethylbilane synthase [Treponema sp.]
MTVSTGTQRIRIGTRQSALALAQTELVAEALRKIAPGIDIEIIKKQTAGDKNLTSALSDFGGKGAFVSEFEEALVRGDIDIAVHSAKDLPVAIAPGLEIAMTLEREDARDVLVWRSEAVQQAACVAGARPVIGTSSPRRTLQIKALFPNCTCSLLRGNVPTRLKKLATGEYDAIILAAAGLKRLGLWNVTDNTLTLPASGDGAAGSNSASEQLVVEPLSFSQMLPAGGQGIIAVECRAASASGSGTEPAVASGDSALRALLASASDSASFASFTVERYLLTKLGTGCHEPTAVFSQIDGRRMTITLSEERDGKPVRKSVTGDIAAPAARAEKDDSRAGACEEPCTRSALACTASGGAVQYDACRLFSLADSLLEKAYE